MSLNNKTVILTGASKGIGKALALELAIQKANLCLIARSETELKEVKDQIEAIGSKAIIFVI